MAQKFLTEITLQALNNATTDTDQFLVSDSGTIKFRTGTQVLSDIGGQAALTNPITGTGTTNYVSKFTGTTTLGNSQIFDNGTNVGIGTTGPTKKLSVSGTIRAFGAGNAGIITSEDTQPGGAAISLNPQFSTGVPGIQTGNSPIAFYTNNSEKMRITSAGNVGIGISSPGHKLQVSGTAGTSWSTLLQSNSKSAVYSAHADGYGMAIETSQNTSAIYTFKVAGGDGTNIGTNEYFRITGTGNVGIGTPTPLSKLDIVSSTNDSFDSITVRPNNLTQTLSLGWQGISASLNFIVNAGASERMRITNTGNIEFGKGLNSPKVFSFEGDTTGVGNSLGGFQWKNVQWDSNIRASINAITDTALANGALIFSTGATNANATEKMRIDSSGNVGIGTIAPAGKLNVIGDIIAGSFTYTTGVNLQNRTAKSVLYISTDGVNNAVGSTITYTWADGGQGPLKFNNSSGEVMRLDASGKLGVGTTSPTSRVHSVTSASGPVSFDNRCAVYGHNTSTETTFNNPIGIAGRVLTSGGMAVYGDASTGSGWAGYFNGKGYFSANVGIGTTTPSYPLDVNGIAILRNALYMTAGGSSSTPNWSFSINGSGDLVVDEAITTQNFIFSNAGQVLIGTTVGGTPTYGSAPQFVTSSSTGGVIDIRNINSTINAGTLLGRLQFTGKSDSSVGYTAAAIEVVTSAIAGTGSSGGGILKFMTAAPGGGQTPTARMWINQLGYATIGLTNSASHPLRVTTQVSNISIYADFDIVAFSDQSVKENIRPIENVIERVQKARGVLYDRIDSGSKDNIGFIAQELEVAFPELVTTNEDGTKAVKYQNAVAVMFEAIKEQQKQIDELKELVNKLIK